MAGYDGLRRRYVTEVSPALNLPIGRISLGWKAPKKQFLAPTADQKKDET